MDAGGASPRSRLLTAREAALRRRRKSLLAGAAGLATLFGAGIIGVAVPGWILPLTLVMVVGVVLLIAAFILARGSGFASSPRSHDR
jgi:hypothetical protein